jgi:DNA-binding IclR family transcriptional regulator
MTEAGYLQKDPVRGYHMGIMAAALTHSDLYSRTLLRSAEKRLKQIAVDHQVYMALALLHDNVRHSILEVDLHGSVVMQVTANANVMISSTGLILVSNQPRHVQDELLEFYGIPRRFNGYEDFIRYLDSIRIQGYVEFTRAADMVAVAVPVYQNGQVIAAVGCYMTNEQRMKADIGEFVALLKDVSAGITSDLEQSEPEIPPRHESHRKHSSRI